MAHLPDELPARIEKLAESLANMTDVKCRETAQSLIEAILELHGNALDRMLHIAFDSGSEGHTLIRKFASDPLVAGLLVLHNLHPDSIETRVRAALSKVNAPVDSVTVTAGVVRVRLMEAGQQLQDRARAAALEAAPDAAAIVIEARASDGFVPLSALSQGIARTS
jgi:FAD/FMN-containing dehydrogenase